ncbi:hypothetical protein C8T65DRAFT_656328 [Cerioporus squamosus]|nr:hypothetical protein C8T65DRAFT_656328 [Cerioporus squamosus]
MVRARFAFRSLMPPRVSVRGLTTRAQAACAAQERILAFFITILTSSTSFAPDPIRLYTGMHHHILNLVDPMARVLDIRQLTTWTATRVYVCVLTFLCIVPLSSPSPFAFVSALRIPCTAPHASHTSPLPSHPTLPGPRRMYDTIRPSTTPPSSDPCVHYIVIRKFSKYSLTRRARVPVRSRAVGTPI